MGADPLKAINTARPISQVNLSVRRPKPASPGNEKQSWRLSHVGPVSHVGLQQSGQHMVFVLPRRPEERQQ